MEVVLLLVVSAAVLVVGVGLGMLVAPRIGRWADRDDEERRDDGSG
jgi:hypothetical protein